MGKNFVQFPSMEQEPRTLQLVTSIDWLSAIPSTTAELAALVTRVERRRRHTAHRIVVPINASAAKAAIGLFTIRRMRTKLVGRSRHDGSAAAFRQLCSSILSMPRQRSFPTASEDGSWRTRAQRKTWVFSDNRNRGPLPQFDDTAMSSF